MRGTSVGDHSPSIPASSSVGWSAVLGQTFMHSPQRMQRERKSGSSSEPGGRSSRSWRLLPRPVLARISGTSAAPAARPVSVLRRPRSGEATSLLFAEEAELKAVVRATAYAVHAHQALGFAPGNAADGIVAALAIEQAAVAFVAGIRVLVQPQHDQRETAPSSAPSGQIARHQSRVMRRLASENGNEQNAQDQPLRELRLAEIEHRELQNRVQDFAGGLDRRDMAVLQRSKH